MPGFPLDESQRSGLVETDKQYIHTHCWRNREWAIYSYIYGPTLGAHVDTLRSAHSICLPRFII